MLAPVLKSAAAAFEFQLLHVFDRLV